MAKCELRKCQLKKNVDKSLNFIPRQKKECCEWCARIAANARALQWEKNAHFDLFNAEVGLVRILAFCVAFTHSQTHRTCVSCCVDFIPEWREFGSTARTASTLNVHEDNGGDNTGSAALTHYKFSMSSRHPMSIVLNAFARTWMEYDCSESETTAYVVSEGKSRIQFSCDKCTVFIIKHYY